MTTHSSIFANAEDSSTELKTINTKRSSAIPSIVQLGIYQLLRIKLQITMTKINLFHLYNTKCTAQYHNLAVKKLQITISKTNLTILSDWIEKGEQTEKPKLNV